MQTELGRKIFSAIQSGHTSFDKDRVYLEIQFMEDHGVCGDVVNLYNKAKQSPELIGHDNVINSLVCYLLGITDKEPGTFKLVPRRTYGRSGFPDIDLDFNHDRRHEIIEYLINKYGREYVSNIGTVQRLTVKNCLHKTIMVLDPDHSVVFDESGKKTKDDRSENYELRSRIVGRLPNIMKRHDGTLVKSIGEAYKEYSGFRQEISAYPEVYRVSQNMEGGISAYGVHAAGMCLSPIPLRYIAPLHVTAGQIQEDEDSASAEKTMATQYTAGDTESLGLIKFDILGLLAKTVITMTTDLIKERYGKTIPIDSLPINDATTLKLLRTGKTDGIFQLEEHGMQRTILEIRIDSFNDLVAAIAMYRPGPLQFIPEYARRKKDPKSVTYLHPIVEKHTKNTYAIIVYQEQAMQIFVELAGLTSSEGYLFIKGSAKKKPELFQSMKNRFVKGATAKSSKEIAEEIWRQMEPFQGYSFNLSHAVSYGYESWKCAYLKAHYPLEFMVARLSIAALERKFEKGDVPKLEEDCVKNLGIKLLPPHLNESKTVYTIVDEKTLRRSLVLKHVGNTILEDIVKHQPYKGVDIVESFANKVSQTIGTKVVEVMCDAGLFGNVSKNKALRTFESIKNDRKKSKGEQKGDLFS